MPGLRSALRATAGSTLRTLSGWASRTASVGPTDRAARRYGRFGTGSIVAWPPGAGFGEHWIWLGNDTLIAAQVTLSAGMGPGQEMVTDPVVRIGDRCVIGRGTAIVGHFSIDIGDDVYMGMNIYITDQNHGYEDLDQPIGTQTPNDDAVSIGSGSWIGSGAVILPGAQIGRHVVVGANSVVRGKVPDNCVVVGSPARVVRRHDGSAWVRNDPGPPDTH
ncbi:MAG: acyltransferase [Acidimicrobiales bacterium]|nr:acyltransferase [Acidimicrobiales bacterium]MDP7118252.1 acyltransferase [Acidimicrobiales bacterium]MDP7411909.1 acyltransferase [Acidimicrobiales bacterium]MEE1521997.1 acyltransferase [Acidimicrobiales bacterium]